MSFYNSSYVTGYVTPATNHGGSAAWFGGSYVTLGINALPSPNKPYRKLTRLGKSSYYVVIPPQIVRKLKWRERQKLVVTRKGKSVAIRDWKPR